MKRLLFITIIIGLVVYMPVFANDFVEDQAFAESEEFSDTDEASDEGEFEEAEFSEEEARVEEGETWIDSLIKPARFTIKHETAYRTASPRQVVNNRSSIRLEYARHFATYFFLQLDTKMNLFWRDDHRARAEEKETMAEGNTKEAFLQSSFGDTSIKIGYQVLIWGESELGAVTDIVSPRDNSEFLFIPLEESRIGQPMLIVDQFTSFGEWQLFYTPEPSFDQLPQKGTAYYVDPSEGSFELFSVEITSDPDEAKYDEFGFRWKRTFGKSDVALMAASLIDNNKNGYLGLIAPFKLKWYETKHRLNLKGLTFNFSAGNFLWKGEFAQKSPKAIKLAQTDLQKLTHSYTLEEREVLDAALGFEYSPAGKYTVTLEASNSHISDWSEDLAGTYANSSVGSFSWSRNFLNDDLSVTFAANHTWPDEDWIYLGQVQYTISDNLKSEININQLEIKNEDSMLWPYRYQNLVNAKLAFQF